jgi:hypothetical protein
MSEEQEDKIARRLANKIVDMVFERLTAAQGANTATRARLNRSSIAKAFDVSSKTIQRWVKDDEFPEHEEHGRPYYFLDECQMWLKRRSKAG